MDLITILIKINDLKFEFSILFSSYVIKLIINHYIINNAKSCSETKE